MNATYLKIKDLEVNLILLKRAELVATEKIHGANFRILIPAGGTVENIVFGAKGTIIKSSSFFAQFIEEIQAQLPLPELVAKLDNKQAWILFGELFGPKIQKDIPYLNEGVGIRFFDIMRNKILIPYNEFTQLTQELGLPVVPELYRGKADIAVFQHLIHEPSSVNENAPREGIVIRDPSLELLDDGQLPLAKFKNEPFREKDYRFSVEDFMQLADEEEKVRQFATMFVTETRIKKMATILREQERLTGTARDIPALTSEVMKDIQAEDAAYYAELEQSMASRSISQKVHQIFTTLLKRDNLA